MVLEWLSSSAPMPKSKSDNSLFVRLYNGDACIDPVNNTYEAPETPAHLFPLRAFKQAIFGTPKPIEATPHRSTSSDAASIISMKSIAPPIAGGLCDRQGAQPHIATQASPTKRTGILLTPGTGVQRHKVVTFRDGLGAKDQGIPILSEACSATLATTDLKERLHSSIRSPKDLQLEHNKLVDSNFDQDEPTLDLNEPRSVSGRYWKREYDIHAEKAQGQLKQVSKREQIARRFAKLKDAEAQQLSLRLEQETTKVAQLEARLSVYVEQLSKSVRKKDETPSSAPRSHLGFSDEDYRRRNQEHIERQDQKASTLGGTSINPSDMQSGSSNVIGLNSKRGFPRSQGKPFLSSDIWADACASDNIDLNPHDEMKAKEMTTQECCLLLQPRSENSQRHKVPFHKPNESSLSVEKREAAKRRLEEKRLARIKISIPVQSSNKI